MPDMSSVVVSVNISDRTGVKKHNVGRCTLVADRGLEDDAHAGDWHRQVSLLAEESIDKMRSSGLDVRPGDFGENLTTRGVELVTLPVGARLKVGGGVLLEVTQIGKECEKPCSIYYQVGDCVMPREGIFAKVLSGGDVAVGDEVTVVQNADSPEALT
jgi:MOSC domain-containing protein YiiM